MIYGYARVSSKDQNLDTRLQPFLNSESMKLYTKELD